MTLAEQRKLLADWLAEWRLERELPPPPAEEVPDGAAAHGDGENAPDLTVGGGLDRGDILLLPPVGEVASSRPVYVALLRQRGPGVWLCAPFSRFSTPATEGEYATGRVFDPLKVVCAWNATTVPASTLAKGWRTGRLSAAEVEVLDAFASGERAELPPSRRGPPLVHPLDPRHDYIEEEKTLWFGVGAQYAIEEDPVTLEVREPPVAWAAEGPADAGEPHGGRDDNGKPETTP